MPALDENIEGVEVLVNRIVEAAGVVNRIVEEAGAPGVEFGTVGLMYRLTVLVGHSMNSQ